MRRAKREGAEQAAHSITADSTSAALQGAKTPVSDLTTGRRQFRPPGAPAGTWPHTAWSHCVLHDPYERVNVWSHGLPGFSFLLLGVLSGLGFLPGGSPMAWFGACAACTHLCSAITHVFPDSHTLEKLDHLGIVALIIGTPATALMAKEHGHLPGAMQVVLVVMLAAAFLPPLPRVLGFAAGVISIVLVCGPEIVNSNLAVQLVMYAAGGLSFLRNGGHARWPGLADHHFLHYFVTAACLLHVRYILDTL